MNVSTRRGSITVQTIRMMTFNRSKAAIGTITSRAVSFNLRKFSAAFIIRLILYVLVKSALKQIEKPVAINHGMDMQVATAPLLSSSHPSKDNGIIVDPINSTPTAMKYYEV